MILKNNKYRLAILVSNPIHYQVPLYRRLFQHPEIDLTVLFCSDFGISNHNDPGWGRPLNYDAEILEGYNYKFLRNISPKPLPNYFFGMINTGLIKQLRKERYDAVWVHGWANATNWICFISCRVIGMPFMLRGESNMLHKRPVGVRVLKRVILKLLFSSAGAFLTIGKLNNDFYRAYGADERRLFPVPYAVDNEFFIDQNHMSHSERNKIREALYISSSEKTVILFVGKLIERKRPFDVLKAYEKIGDGKAVLMFVGDGAQRKELEEYVHERNMDGVYFTGFQSQKELPRIFSIADVFVLPSSNEPWGMVVNEAMNFGLPVITSDKVGAAYDLVRAGENGFIYPDGDVDKLAEFLSRLIANAELREKMGKRSLDIVSKWSFREDVEGILAALKYLKQ